MGECIYTQEQFDKILKERNQLANENFKLKQQLAEKDKEIKNLNKEFVQSIHDWKELIKKKDEEIKQLKLDLRMFKSVNEFINNYGEDKD